MHQYTWRATYHDGTVINETDGHEWSELDLSKLQYIQIINRLGIVVFNVAVSPEHPPEFFRREVDGVTCVGWPGAYVWILDDGTMALTAVKEVKI